MRIVLIGATGMIGGRIAEAVDAPGFPAELLPRALAQVALRELIRDDAEDLEWSYVSPPAVLAPGTRTGVYRVGGRQLLVDGEGDSSISVEDFAVALVDELEKGELIRHPAHIAY